jgi:hypothetical protein
MKVSFICCFCHAEIEDNAHEINMSNSEGAQQIWFCHISCFEQSTGYVFQGEIPEEESERPASFLEELRDPEFMKRLSDKLQQSRDDDDDGIVIKKVKQEKH